MPIYALHLIMCLFLFFFFFLLWNDKWCTHHYHLFHLFRGPPFLLNSARSSYLSICLFIYYYFLNETSIQFDLIRFDVCLLLLFFSYFIFFSFSSPDNAYFFNNKPNLNRIAMKMKSKSKHRCSVMPENGRQNAHPPKMVDEESRWCIIYLILIFIFDPI